MRLKELISTNLNTLEYIYIYFDKDQYDSEEYTYKARGMRQIAAQDRDATVRSWYIDDGSNLHVLLF